MNKWKSCAEWPENTVSCNIMNMLERNYTTDNHDTEKQARAVCKMLKRDGFGGNGKIFPIITWVEEIIENSI